jgi:diphthamide synthase subunit DPH2
LATSGNGKTAITLPDGFNTQGWEVIGFVQNNTNGEILAAAKANFNAGK